MATKNEVRVALRVVRGAWNAAWPVFTSWWENNDPQSPCFTKGVAQAIGEDINKRFEELDELLRKG